MCRYVNWTAYVLRFHGKSGPVEPVPLPGAPFSHYYAQDSSADGLIMETDVAVKQVNKIFETIESGFKFSFSFLIKNLNCCIFKF